MPWTALLDNRESELLCRTRAGSRGSATRPGPLRERAGCRGHFRRRCRAGRRAPQRWPWGRACAGPWRSDCGQWSTATSGVLSGRSGLPTVAMRTETSPGPRPRRGRDRRFGSGPPTRPRIDSARPVRRRPRRCRPGTGPATRYPCGSRRGVTYGSQKLPRNRHGDENTISARVITATWGQAANGLGGGSRPARRWGRPGLAGQRAYGSTRV